MSYASLSNLHLLEEIYDKWLENPSDVDPSWQYFFEGMQLGSSLKSILSIEKARSDSLDLRVDHLICAYRTYGHLLASFNPLSSEEPPFPDELKLDTFFLSQEDLSKSFPTCGLIDQEMAPLSQILQVLKEVYCQKIGFEYMDLGCCVIEAWIQKRIEPQFPKAFSKEKELKILDDLNRAEGFESFLHTKYVGQKRFSLQGAETLIPMLCALVERGGDIGVEHFILGMAHRGRLNVLANVMGKSYSYIFEEFEDTPAVNLFESSGDVKYHMGFEGEYLTEHRAVQVTLAANPSHLESVNPVVEGMARALQEKKDSKKIVPVLIHGDAAIAGQGVVYESMNMSHLKGYQTGGSIHIVINNQIGYTTLPFDGRSTRYCTDIAKAFGAPVFHVNAEDPKGCVSAMEMAIDLRDQFGCDVFIDLVGYRKYGHNESDEPTFTQPLEYQIIRSKVSIRTLYKEQLLKEGVLSEETECQAQELFNQSLSQSLLSVESKVSNIEKKEIFDPFAPIQTQVPLATLQSLAKHICTVPGHLQLHPKLLRLLKNRAQMLESSEEKRIDWGMGEMLAYGSLLNEGVHLRISGQDVRRGTFSHRHAVYVDQVNAEHYYPLAHLSQTQSPFSIYNSHLSEMGVLGFEFGYSYAYPKSLVIWEAQFGDFCNGAQIIIDQYIASSAVKWGQSTNLTLLLPHGNEGMGPEHTSGRMERFLQLCAEENMYVANPSTPAQFFHLLRRQALIENKRPLIVFTPKMLLRFPLARSSPSEFAEGKFEEILDDPNPPSNPKRILLCTGKIYYELLAQREKGNHPDVLIRVEQIYPLHKERLKALLQKYKVESITWVQEEHQNMGPWPYLRPHLEEIASTCCISRSEAASPAAGSLSLHNLQHQALIKQLYPIGGNA